MRRGTLLKDSERLDEEKPAGVRPAMDRRAFLAASIGAGLASCRQQPSEVATRIPLADVLSMDALGQAELIRGKEIQPIELVDAIIEQIEKLNPKLNAVITKMYDLARKAAQGTIPEGPFRGVPFLLKDLIASYAGVRMTAGSKALKDYVPKFDSELVVRQKRAGLIILGKTNTPEFGLTATTEPHLFGATHNPWELNHTPGGSSGGSPAAVTARILPMAHANDGGGSIRIPASCCGIFGLKPTRARNPLGPEYGDIMNGLVAEHAVTLTVRDSAVLLDATSGLDLGDPYYAPPKQRPFLQEVGADPGRLRVAFSTKAHKGSPVHADCIAAVNDTAKLMEKLGHHVEEKAPQIDASAYADARTAVWLPNDAAIVEGLAASTGRAPSPDDYEPMLWGIYQEGKKQPAWKLVLAVRYLQSLSRQVAEFFTRFDVWLTPTLGAPPPPLGTLHPTPEDKVVDFHKTYERLDQFIPFTPLANETGQPAMSVPLFWNRDGLPIGVHFMGRFGDEATLFRLAAQLEQARPWAERRPPVCVGSAA